MKFIKKLTSILIVMLTVASLFSGCTAKKPAPWTSFIKDAGNRWELGTMEKALAEIENVPIKDLTVYDFFWLDHNIVPPLDDRSVITPWLHLMNGEYPIERIEKIDGDHVFVVYKARYEKQTVIFRVMLKKYIMEYSDKTEELWGATYNRFYNEGEHSYSDFANLKIGDTAQKVAKIDDTFVFDTKNVIAHDGKCVFTSKKLLTDGMLEITYSGPAEAAEKDSKGYPDLEKMIITDIVFSDSVEDIIKIPEYEIITPEAN